MPFELQPLSFEEFQLLTAVEHRGRAIYPVLRCGKKWILDTIKGCSSFPCIYDTKREAIEHFDRYVEMLKLRRTEDLRRSNGNDHDS